MSRELEGKVAIVIGSATGIGEAIAHSFGGAPVTVEEGARRPMAAAER